MLVMHIKDSLPSSPQLVGSSSWTDLLGTGAGLCKDGSRDQWCEFFWLSCHLEFMGGNSVVSFSVIQDRLTQKVKGK